MPRYSNCRIGGVMLSIRQSRSIAMMEALEKAPNSTPDMFGGKSACPIGGERHYLHGHKEAIGWPGGGVIQQIIYHTFPITDYCPTHLHPNCHHTMYLHPYCHHSTLHNPYCKLCNRHPSCHHNRW